MEGSVRGGEKIRARVRVRASLSLPLSLSYPKAESSKRVDMATPLLGDLETIPPYGGRFTRTMVVAKPDPDPDPDPPLGSVAVRVKAYEAPGCRCGDAPTEGRGTERERVDICAGESGSAASAPASHSLASAEEHALEPTLLTVHE